MTCENSLKI